MNQAVLERMWQRRASALATRLNLAWWMERFNQLLLTGLPVLAVAILAVRTWREPWISPAGILVALAGLLAIGAFTAWLLARKRFVTGEDGLVRLDERLGLHNRLVSASRKVGPWPVDDPAFDPTTGLHWRAGRVLLPGLGALLLVLAASFTPLPEPEVVPRNVVEPGAWDRMQEWLETLDAADFVDEKAIEQFESHLEELKERPEEEWFSHSSLEATDTLEEALGQEIRDLASGMNTLERSLSTLESYDSESGGEAGQEAAQEMEAALESLGQGGLPLNEDLRKQLGEIDPSSLGKATVGGLSQEALEALQGQLGKGMQALGSLEGLPGLEEGMAFGVESPGFGEGEGEAPGKGGLSRGRGDAPLVFDEEADQLGTSNIEGIRNEDLSRATLGETIGLGETERKIDPTPSGPVAGGAATSLGQGGEAVSRQPLLPDEQAVLKRFFK